MPIISTTSGDAEAIATIIKESNIDVAEEFELNFDNNPKHPSFCKKEWVLADFERGEEYFLYQQNGVNLGCIAFENPRPEVAYLNRLSVLPGYRRKGVGEDLVSFVLNYAKTKGIKRVSIGIIAKHLKLKNWYVKLGFVEGEKKVFPHLPFDVQYLSYTP